MKSDRVTFWGRLSVLALALALCAGAAAGQTLRRQQRLQKRLEKAEAKKATPERAVVPATQASTAGGAPPKAHSLDGVRQNPQRLFTPEEQSLVIRGFGRPPALLLLFRQLDLTPEQKDGIRAIRQRVGLQLVNAQSELPRLERELEEAIYGEIHDPKRVEALAAQVAERQGEVVKLRAGVESDIRALLTPDQLFVYRFMIGELVMPNRRVQPAQLLRQQQLQRRNLPNRPPNSQVPPPIE